MGASQNYIQEETGTDATANDNVLLLTITNTFLSDYTIHALAGTVDVEVSIDGTNWTNAVPVMDVTGAPLASDQIAAGQVGVLTGPFRGLRVRKKGTTNPTTVAVLGRG